MTLPPSAPINWRIANENPSFASRYEATQRLVDFPSYQWWTISSIMGQRHVFLEPGIDYVLAGEAQYWYMIDQVNVRAKNLFNLLFDVEYPKPDFDFDSLSPFDDGSAFRNFAYERGVFDSYGMTELNRQQRKLQDARRNGPTLESYLKSILTQNEYDEYVYWAQGQARTSSSYTSRVARFTAQAGVIVGAVALGTVAAPAIGAAASGTGAVAPASAPWTLPSLPSVTLAEAGAFVTSAQTLVKEVQAKKSAFDSFVSQFLPKKDVGIVGPPSELAGSDSIVGPPKSLAGSSLNPIVLIGGVLVLIISSIIYFRKKV